MEYVHNSVSQVCNCMNSQKDVFVKCQPWVWPTHKHQFFTVSFCTSSCLSHSFREGSAPLHCYGFCFLFLHSTQVDSTTGWKRKPLLLRHIQERFHGVHYQKKKKAKKPACLFISSLIHGGKQKEDLSTQMNKTQTKLLVFLTPGQGIISFWFLSTARNRKVDWGGGRIRRDTSEKHSYLHGLLYITINLNLNL